MDEGRAAANRSGRRRRRRTGRHSGAATSGRCSTGRTCRPTSTSSAFLTISWRAFFGLIAVAYIVFNLAVRGASIACRTAASRGRATAFANAFFFSVQTTATIGYGEMAPATLYANLLVSTEVLLGLMGFALATEA